MIIHPINIFLSNYILCGFSRDPVVSFNYAVFLFKQNEMDKAKTMIEMYQMRLENYKSGTTKLQKEVRTVVS